MRCVYVIAAFCLVNTLSDINSTSMHGFYWDRLAATYGVVRRQGQDGTGVADASWARLSMRDSPDEPRLVICAATNCTRSGDLPPGRGCVSFTFTPETTGLSRTPDADHSPDGDSAPLRACSHTGTQPCRTTRNYGNPYGAKYYVTHATCAYYG